MFIELNLIFLWAKVIITETFVDKKPKDWNLL